MLGKFVPHFPGYSSNHPEKGNVSSHNHPRIRQFWTVLRL